MESRVETLPSSQFDYSQCDFDNHCRSLLFSESAVSFSGFRNNYVATLDCSKWQSFFWHPKSLVSVSWGLFLTPCKVHPSLKGLFLSRSFIEGESLELIAF